MQITIWGRDGSGKSTLADYLGVHLAQKEITVVIDTDLTQPTITNRLPGRETRKEQSLGRAISGTGTTEIRPYLIQHPKHEALFFSGLVHGEDYMEYELGLDSAAMANLFISSCKTVADNIILDCSGQRTDPFIPEALTGSDVVIVLLTPDLQGITWWQSVQSLLQELKVSDKAIPVFSMIHSHHNENWLQEAIDLKNIVSIPFAPELNLLRSSGQTTDKPVTRAGSKWEKGLKRLLADIYRTRGDNLE